MNALTQARFDDAQLAVSLDTTDPHEMDQFDFGVIGFDASTNVQIYNALESRLAGLAVNRVVGQPLFAVVAPCMNNFMVAQRFEDAAAAGTPLDVTIDYVLTLRMRPIKVRLRLLSNPGAALRYLLVNRVI